MARLLVCALSAAFALAAFPAGAAEKVKIGFISTLSGPNGVTGKEMLDGFKLGITDANGKFGGRDVDLVTGDDQGKPDVGVEVARKLLDKDKVELVTGVVLSNILLAVSNVVLPKHVILISLNAGASDLAGRECSPYFFNVSFQNDSVPEAMGANLQEKGLKHVYLLAPNYAAGRDMLNGFKRTYKGSIVGEVYTQMNQLDFAAELSAIQAAKPEAVFIFYPGSMGINFIRQYAEWGLKAQIPLYATTFTMDQTLLPAMGNDAIGIMNSGFWSESLDNPENRVFVERFEAEFKRIPSAFAATAYDGARLIDAAMRATGGRIDSADAFRKALEAAKFASVRGHFRFNTNHFPIQDYYLFQVEKGPSGELVDTMRERIFSNRPDSYVSECKMK